MKTLLISVSLIAALFLTATSNLEAQTTKSEKARKQLASWFLDAKTATDKRCCQLIDNEKEAKDVILWRSALEQAMGKQIPDSMEAFLAVFNLLYMFNPLWDSAHHLVHGNIKK